MRISALHDPEVTLTPTPTCNLLPSGMLALSEVLKVGVSVGPHEAAKATRKHSASPAAYWIGDAHKKRVKPAGDALFRRISRAIDHTPRGHLSFQIPMGFTLLSYNASDRKKIDIRPIYLSIM